MFYDKNSQDSFDALVTDLGVGDGIAFLGAGLSAVTLPGWAALHGLLQDEANLQPRRVFGGDSAPIDFEAFRGQLGADRFLQILKTQFARAVTTL